MKEMILTSTILISVILLLRFLLRGRVHPKLQYALWLLVVVRLLCPLSFGSSPVSVLNLLPEETGYLLPMEMQTDLAAGNGMGVSDMEKKELELEGQKIRNQKFEAQNQKEYLEQLQNAAEKAQAEVIAQDEKSIVKILTAIWLGGIVLTGGYMLFYQRKWQQYRKQNRKPFAECKQYRGLSVYTVQGLPSPCLSGRSIYLTKEMAEDKQQFTHILAHEYCHYKQGDSAWVMVRCLLTAVYWFHPLVWVAAYISRQDSELACDEAAIRLLGEEERFAYGKTLLQLIAKEPSSGKRFGIASTMSGQAKGIRERIARIAGRKRYRTGFTVLVLVLVVLMAGMTLTGRATKKMLVESNAVTVQSVAPTESSDVIAPSDEMTESSDTISQNDVKTKNSQITANEEAEVAALLDSYTEQMIEANTEDENIKNPKDYVQAFAKQGQEALEEGIYLLEQAQAENGKRICIYGIYSREYGCRGVAIYIDGDCNSYDIQWMPSGMCQLQDNIVLYESEEKGEPRTFAWKQVVVNDSASEIWQLYLCDRYDTGTIEQTLFAREDYLYQMQERVSFEVLQEEKKIYVYDKEPGIEKVLAGVIDFSTMENAGEKVEEVVLDGSMVGYRLGNKEEELELLTGIGLRFQGHSEICYQGLNLLCFPVECGSFGDREFHLGQVSVEMDYVNGMK